MRMSPYLALDSGETAGAGLRAAASAALAAALLAGDADGAQLVPLLAVDAPHAGRPEQSAALADAQRLQEKVLVHLRARHVDLLLADVRQRQRRRRRLLRLQHTIFCQLCVEQVKVSQRSLVKKENQWVCIYSLDGRLNCL